MSPAFAPAARLTFLTAAMSLSASMLGVASGMLPYLAPRQHPAAIAPAEALPASTDFRLHPVGRVVWT